MPRVRIRSALALLCACLCLAACAPLATTTAATATASPTPTPPPTATPAPEWVVYTDPKYGFKIAVPAALWADPQLQPPPQSGSSYVQYIYRGMENGQTSPVGILFAPIDGLALYASTTPAQCDLHGTSVRVGAGITGYQSDTFTNPPTGTGAYAPGGSVSFVTGGLYVSIFVGANTTHSKSDYWTTFGPVWQHMLASFVPGPAIPGAHPCG